MATFSGSPATFARRTVRLQAKGILASVRPRDLAGKTRKRLAVEQLAELVAVDKNIKALTKELKAMVLSRGSTLMDLRGVGRVVAARTLADVGDVAHKVQQVHLSTHVPVLAVNTSHSIQQTGVLQTALSQTCGSSERGLHFEVTRPSWSWCLIA